MKPAIQTLLLNFFRRHFEAEFSEVSKETQKTWGFPEHFHDIIKIKNLNGPEEVFGIVSVKTERYEKVAFNDSLYRKLPNRDKWILIAVDTDKDVVQWLSVPDIDQRLKTLEFRTSAKNETVFLVPWVDDFWSDSIFESIWPDTEELHILTPEAFYDRYKIVISNTIEQLITAVISAHKEKAHGGTLHISIGMTPLPENPLEKLSFVVNVSPGPDKKT
jgi:hypothetical protein